MRYVGNSQVNSVSLGWFRLKECIWSEEEGNWDHERQPTNGWNNKWANGVASWGSAHCGSFENLHWMHMKLYHREVKLWNLSLVSFPHWLRITPRGLTFTSSVSTTKCPDDIYGTPTESSLLASKEACIHKWICSYYPCIKRMRWERRKQILSSNSPPC